jgi:hypothetical protein
MTLYFVKCRDKIKIGISDTFDARISKLRRENAEEIEVLRIVHGDADTILELERSLHQELGGVKSHHEWFEDCPQVRAAIEGIFHFIRTAPDSARKTSHRLQGRLRLRLFHQIM